MKKIFKLLISVVVILSISLSTALASNISQYTFDTHDFTISIPSNMHVVTKNNINKTNVVLIDEYKAAIKDETIAFIAFEKNYEYQIAGYVVKDFNNLKEINEINNQFTDVNLMINLHSEKEEEIKTYANSFYSNYSDDSIKSKTYSILKADPYVYVVLKLVDNYGGYSNIYHTICNGNLYNFIVYSYDSAFSSNEIDTIAKIIKSATYENDYILPASNQSSESGNYNDSSNSIWYVFLIGALSTVVINIVVSVLKKGTDATKKTVEKAFDSHDQKLEYAYRCYNQEIVEEVFPGGIPFANSVFSSITKILNITALTALNKNDYHNILKIYSDVFIRTVITPTLDESIVAHLLSNYNAYIKTEETAIKIMALCTMKIRNNAFNFDSDENYKDLKFFEDIITQNIKLVNSNEGAVLDNIDDFDYGIVPEKPIYVRGLSGTQKYLDSLQMVTGEKVHWERKGSTTVSGINGPVDIYTAYLENGTAFKTIYINIYSRHTSKVGFEDFYHIDEFKTNESESAKADAIASTESISESSESVSLQETMDSMDKINAGEYADISIAQITNCIISLQDAKKKLSDEQYDNIFELYLELQKNTKKLTINLETYYEISGSIIKKFDQIAPYELYSGADPAETALLMNVLRS